MFTARRRCTDTVSHGGRPYEHIQHKRATDTPSTARFPAAPRRCRQAAAACCQASPIPTQRLDCQRNGARRARGGVVPRERGGKDAAGSGEHPAAHRPAIPGCLGRKRRDPRPPPLRGGARPAGQTVRGRQGRGRRAAVAWAIARRQSPRIDTHGLAWHGLPARTARTPCGAVGQGVAHDRGERTASLMVPLS